MSPIATATPEELKSITGLERPSAIRRFLDRHGIPYIVGADKWPRVLPSIILERLGASSTPAPAKREPRLRLRNG